MTGILYPDYRPPQNRRVRSLIAAAALFVATATTPVAAADIALPGDAAYPESIASASDGTLYVSGFAGGGIARVAPGADRGEMWIAPGAFGTRSTFGVLVDETSN